MSRPDPDVTDVFRRLDSVPVSRRTVRSVVDEVAEQASGPLGVLPLTSLTVVSDAPPRTVASSGPLAVRLDAVQYREDAGPCLSAARTGEPTGAVGGIDDRWQRFAGALEELGCDSVWSHPLPVEAPAAASLNLYLPAGVDPERRAIAAALVEAAVVPVANVWLYAEAVRRSENLLAALETRAVIEQAKGILMERLKVTADGAFETLARVSNDTNTKLRDVAQAVVDTGTSPPEPLTRRGPAPR